MNPVIIGKATLHNMDCMELLKATTDKFYDLAIVDPPYGIGMDGGNVGYKGDNNFEKKNWDSSIPSMEYFNELSRASKSQIIWGGNYFGLPATRCFLIWDKGAGFKARTYAECEQAWTSFDANARIYQHDPLAMGDYKGKIHPTQKPVKLYEWLLTNYAKQGDKILDTHLGSGSHAIACNNLGFELTACELDKDYFEASLKRIKAAAAQERLFD
jgi:site-specific DNA-methyltransferase (adenine-specific)